MRRPALIALVSSLAVLCAPRDADARWRWPVRGEVITPFAVHGSPFAAGQHRGIDIAAGAGERVSAPCSGTVRFAGRVPGRGRAVTLACGRLVATVLELGSTTVARGERVVAGAAIGTAAASHVQLGARRDGAPHGYLDPRDLLGEDVSAPPPLVAPAARPRGRGPTRDGPVPAEVARPTASAPDQRVPVVAWAGFGLLLAAAPVGVARRRARAARRTGALETAR